MSKRLKFTDNFNSQIVALYKVSKSVGKLSKEYDVTAPTIYKWINKTDSSGSP